MAKSYFVDNELYKAAGIHPTTHLPDRIHVPKKDEVCNVYDNLKDIIDVIDRQDAIRRYKWNNLPIGLTSDLVERMLYYKGEIMFFKMEDENYYMLPFALNDSIDVYGRYNEVTPLPFNGTAQTEEDAWITGLRRKVIKTLPTEITDEMRNNGCVLLFDYTNAISQHIEPRFYKNEILRKLLAETMPIARTTLFNSAGVEGMLVSDESEQSNVEAASQSLRQAVLNGRKWLPICRKTSPNFEELGEKASTNNVDSVLKYYNAINNIRLTTYGLKNTGVVEKSQYLNEQEIYGSQQHLDFNYQDGLIMREEFCEKVNKVWGLNIEVEPFAAMVVGEGEQIISTLADAKEKGIDLGVKGEDKGV